MKKMIAAVTVATLALSFAACGGAAEENTSPDTQATTPSTQETTPSTQAPSEKPEQTQPQKENFKEIVLVDNDDVTVKVTGIEEDTMFGFELNVFLENKTDKELMFTVDGVSINGFMCDPFWADPVAAGKKSNTGISWFEDDLKDNNITTVDDVSFILKIYEEDDVLAKDVFSDTFTLHVHG